MATRSPRSLERYLASQILTRSCSPPRPRQDAWTPSVLSAHSLLLQNAEAKQADIRCQGCCTCVLVQVGEMWYPAACQTTLEMTFTSDIPIAISSPRLSIVPLKASSRLLVKSCRRRQSFHGTLSSRYLSPITILLTYVKDCAEDGTLTTKWVTEISWSTRFDNVSCRRRVSRRESSMRHSSCRETGVKHLHSSLLLQRRRPQQWVKSL